MDAAPRTGYRPSQKLLHWLTVLAVAAQLAVGYNLDLDDDCDPPGENLGGGDTSDAFEDRLDRFEDACEARADDYDLLGGGFGLVRGWIAATVLLLGLVAFVPIRGIDRAVAESSLAPLVLHGAKAASYVAPAALRQAYSENFEKVRQVWSPRPESSGRNAAADAAKPDPTR